MSDINTKIELAAHQFRTEVRVDEKGVGYASLRGVARLLGLGESTLIMNVQRFKSPDHKMTSKSLEYVIQRGIEPAHILQSDTEGLGDIAVAFLTEYYAFRAGKNCTEQAQLILCATSAMGFRTWMRDLVGWHQPVNAPFTPTDIKAFLVEQLPEKPKTWECRFAKTFWTALEELYGLKQNQRACAMFISHWVYGYFPPEVRERIDEINPRLEDGSRKNLIHPHFDKTLEKALKMQIELVTVNLIKARSRSHFKRLMKKARRYSFTVDNLRSLEAS